MLTKAVYADTEGFVSEMDTRALGMAVVAMGGGRRQASDTIDYSVGFTDMARLGDQTVSVRWRLSTRKTKTAGRKRLKR